IDPTSGTVVREFTEMSAEGGERCLARAAETYRGYRPTGFAQRAEWIRAAADLLDAGAEGRSAVMTRGMGRPRRSAAAELGKCAKLMRFYAEHAEGFLADVPGDAGKVGARSAYTRYLPLGPVLAVMPWNFPMWQVVRFAAPALMAGNVG